MAEDALGWEASGLGWMRKLRELRREGTTWRGSKVRTSEGGLVGGGFDVSVFEGIELTFAQRDLGVKGLGLWTFVRAERSTRGGSKVKRVGGLEGLLRKEVEEVGS